MRLPFVVVLFALPALVHAQGSVVRGRITDALTKRAVTSTVELNARDTTITRDAATNYTINGLPEGQFELVVRAIGYQSLRVRVTLAANDTVDADVELERIATTLAKVKTDSAAPPEGYAARLSEFEERRAFGMGRFLDWRFFEENQNQRLEQLLDGRVAGLKVLKRGSTKTRFVTTRTGSNCFPQVIVNGIIDDDFDLSLVDTHEVLAFEFYTPANTPLKCNRTTIGRSGQHTVCGTVILWLR